MTDKIQTKGLEEEFVTADELTPYLKSDQAGSSNYARLDFSDTTASNPNFFRVPANAGGILPYSNSNSFVGSSAWKFKEIHGVDFFEGGEKLEDKYEVKGTKVANAVQADNATTADFADLATLATTATNATTAANATKLNSQDASYYRNATNLNSGTISDARLPDTISSNITGSAASAATASNASKLNSQDASYYRNASNINAGTISDARLPSSISSDITGNAATATWADTVDVNTSTSTSWFGALWSSGDTVYTTTDVRIRPSDGSMTIKKLYINDTDGTGGYFYEDSTNRVAYTGGDFYIQSGVANTYLYATNTYLGNTTGSTIRFRGSTITANAWGWNPNGQLTLRKDQSANRSFAGAALKLLPSATTNTTGRTSIALSTSTVDNYGWTINGWRNSTGGDGVFSIDRHSNSDATGTSILTASSSGVTVSGTVTATTFSGNLSGNATTATSATTATKANTLKINTSASTSYYDVLWRSGENVYKSTSSKFTVSGTGNLRCGGNITAYYSDSRLKDVITDIDPDEALRNVCKWRKVKYTANQLANDLAGYNTDKVEIGLLADEIKQDYPEVTPLAPFDSTDEVDAQGNSRSKSGQDYSTLNYERLVAVQAAAIEALEARLAKLEAKVGGA